MTHAVPVRSIHLDHPAMPGVTLCGYHKGEGCRIARAGEVVTCACCREVVHWCRDTVKLGVLAREVPA